MTELNIPLTVYLGTLCSKNHEYQNTGKSLRLCDNGCCQQCRKEYQYNYYQQHYSRNRQKILEQKKKYYQRNKEKIILYYKRRQRKQLTERLANSD